MKVRITRSDRRARTVSAKIVGDTIEVSAPAHLADEELQPLVEKLVARLERRRERRALDDAALQRIAEELNRRRIPSKKGGRWHASTVRYILQNDLHGQEVA